jgi:Tol biopolymer transport system component
MRRALIFVSLAACAAAALPASAEHGPPWHTVASIPLGLTETAVAGTPGLVGGGGHDVSADGRFVAYTYPAPDDMDGCADPDCVGHWRYDGETGLSEPVGVAWDGSGGPTIIIPEPRISNDGRYVAYTDAEFRGVFVRDMETDMVQRVDVSSGGAQANAGAFLGDISGNGRFVVFSTRADNLVPGDTAECPLGNDMVNCNDVFVHDLQTGDTERVSFVAGSQPDGESTSGSISDDGWYVTYISDSTNLTPEGVNDTCPSGVVNQMANCRQVFVYDRETQTTTLVSKNMSGEPSNGHADSPEISGNGGFVTFLSDANDLVPADSNGIRDVFVRDLEAGLTERVSVMTGGGQAMTGLNNNPTISADGDRVAFSSTSDELGPDQSLGRRDIFVRERGEGETHRVNVSLAGDLADASSSQPVMSADGRHVLFFSTATNLAPDEPGNLFMAEREQTGPPPHLLRWGDVNCSGAMDSVDALASLRRLAGFDPAQMDPCPDIGVVVDVVSASEHIWGDVDCSGAADSLDALKILRVVAGLPAPNDPDCPQTGSQVEVVELQ